jgi:hypothetical protein
MARENNWLLRLLLLIVLSGPALCPGAELLLAVDGKTGYTIIVPPKATPADHVAVSEDRLNRLGAPYR